MSTRITVLVDNRAERPGLATEHGLSLWIEHGDCKILFDTGASGRALLANADALGIDLATANAVCLSHGHLDHTGGLAAALPKLAGADLYAHPLVFGEKFSRSAAGWHSIGIPLTKDQIESAGVLTHLSEDPQEVCPGATLLGAVERDESLVPPTPHLYASGAVGRTVDKFPDDLALVLEVGGGIVVVTGCAHAGIVNHCRAAQRHVNPDDRVGKGDVVAVVGGFHLGGTPPEFIQATIEGLRRIAPARIHPCHCTGKTGADALVRAFGPACKPIATGSVLEFPG